MEPGLVLIVELLYGLVPLPLPVFGVDETGTGVLSTILEL
jgi:hypothetical protein